MQAKAKGFNDLCIQLIGAVGTLLTGFAVAEFGWSLLVCISGNSIGQPWISWVNVYCVSPFRRVIGYAAVCFNSLVYDGHKEGPTSY